MIAPVLVCRHESWGRTCPLPTDLIAFAAHPVPTDAMQPRDLCAYLFLAITWGLSFIVVLNVVHGFGWVGAVTLRALLAGITLLLLATLRRRRLHFSPVYKHLVVVGATTVAGQLIGLSYATPRIGTAMAAIFVAAIPLFSMLIGRLWGLEKLTATGVVGLVLGLGGIILLVGFPAQTVTPAFIHGSAACIGGALCAAFGSNYASVHLRDTDAWVVTSGSFLAGGLLTLPLLLWVPLPGMPSAREWLYLAVSGCIMSAMTYVLYFGLVSRIGATRSISVEFVVTLVAVGIGALFLGESLSLLQLAGCATIISGCALVLGLLPMRRRPLSSSSG